jgi:hypothetical protein
MTGQPLKDASFGMCVAAVTVGRQRAIYCDRPEERIARPVRFSIIVW